ncbi:MAG: tyrosine-type recombinase/integrase [Spartobacteria bacterium]
MKRIQRNLFRHENGTYYIIRRVGAQQSKKSLGTKDKAVAKGLLRAQRNSGDLFKSPLNNGPQINRPDFLSAVEEHGQNTSFAREKTERNFLQRKRTLLSHCSTWENFQPVSVWKKYDALGFVSAQNQFRWYLRSFVSYCVERGWLSELYQADVGKIRLKRVPPRRVQIPEPEQVRELLLMVEAENRELGQFLRWIAYSGLRLTGAKEVQWEEINFTNSEYVREMKGGQTVVIPLLPEAQSLLLARFEKMGQPSRGPIFDLNDYDIRKLRRLLRNFASGLEVDLEYPHAFRHAFGSVALSSGLSPAEVALLLGHKDGGKLVLSTYGHVIPTQLKSKVSGQSVPL